MAKGSNVSIPNSTVCKKSTASTPLPNSLVKGSLMSRTTVPSGNGWQGFTNRAVPLSTTKQNKQG